MIRKQLSIGVLIGVLAAPVGYASAQSFNIDFGDAAGQPDVEFHGAAGQDGVWNTVAPEPDVPVGLRDVGGNSTAATVTTDMPSIAIPDDQIVGDNEALLEDGLLGNGDVVRIFTFDGLQNGTYQILIYGFTPTQETHTTTIIPPAGITGLQPIGGAWPGDFEAGITHDSFEMDVTDGVLRIEYVGSFLGSQGFINGVQITMIDDDIAPEPQPEDLNADGSVGVQDLLMLLSSWTDGHGCDGIDDGCPADFNGDRFVDVLDLLQLLSEWG